MWLRVTEPGAPGKEEAKGEKERPMSDRKLRSRGPCAWEDEKAGSAENRIMYLNINFPRVFFGGRGDLSHSTI